MDKQDICIFWFRRDLRLEDNAGLHKALTSGCQVLPIFIFDKHILDDLTDKSDKRLSFIWQEVKRLKEHLEENYHSSLAVFYGDPKEVFETLLNQYNLKLVIANRDYEPYAKKRDKEIYDLLKEQGIDFKGVKDQVLMEKEEVMKSDGDPYVVYTPYSKQYKELLTPKHFETYPSAAHLNHCLAHDPFPMPSLADMGFEMIEVDIPSREIKEDILETYHKTRDIPALEEGTSRLSVHLRFGTISVRKLALAGRDINTKFFNELIWRDFYQMILYHFPKTVTESFRPEYDHINWENKEEDFEKWKEGKTGYPLVDAGMRQLNQSGYMHNRVRMLVASFLTKHLLIDWRWGEAYFAEKLLDYDQASNIGGWQWAAGSGVDAAPYFRIFNPELQLDKFDPDRKYVKRWIPEFDSSDYPDPMIDHKFARERALDRYKKALAKD